MINSKKSEYSINFLSNIDLAEQTSKSLYSKNLFGIISSAFILLLDAILLILSCIFAAESGFIITSSLLILVDAIFLFVAIKSNYKSRYFLGYQVLYGLLSLVLSIVLSIMGYNFSANRFYIDLLSSISLALCKVLLLATIILMIQLIISKNKKGKLLISTIFLFIASLGFVSIFLGKTYFASNTNYRKVVYTLTDDGTYEVSDVLGGIGNKILIEDEFNGIKITSIDARIFSRDDISTIEISSKKELPIKNYTKYELNENVTLKVPASNIDYYRGYLYKLPNSFRNLYKKTIPTLESNQYYINFDYDDTDLPNLYKNGNLMPTFIGEVGIDNFELNQENLGDALYVYYINRFKENLEYCYEELDKYRLKEDSFDVVSNSQSASVCINFERIYKVNRNKGIYSYYSSWDDVDYITESILDMDLKPYRKGCTVNWEMLTLGSSNIMIDDANDIFNYVSNAMLDEITIVANWTINEFKDVHFSINSDTTFEYGKEIRFNYSAKHDLDISYSISSSSFGVINDLDNNYLLTPNNSGKYILTLTVVDIYDKNFTYKSTAELNITVNKKSVDLIWNGSANVVYDAQDHMLLPIFDSTQLIGNDECDISFESIKYKDAGSYIYRVSLTGEESEFYDLTNPSVQLIISPREVEIDFISPEDLTYSGKPYKIDVMLSNICNGDSVNSYVIGDTYENAGLYITEVTGLSNKNYKLPDEKACSYQWEIKKYQTTVQWDLTEETTRVYNGLPQSYTVSVIGVSSLKLDAYCTTATNVGVYDLEVSLLGTLDQKNYELKDYLRNIEITPKPIDVIVSDNRLVFNGQTQSPEVSVEKTQICQNDVVNVMISGNINAGTYEEDVKILNENYIPTVSRISYTIFSLNVKLMLNMNSLEYTGKDLFNKIQGYYLDINQNKINVNLTKIEMVNASKYILSLDENQTIDSNYKFEAQDFQVTFEVLPKKTELLVKENEFTYNGSNQFESVKAYYIDVNNNEQSVELDFQEMINIGSYKLYAKSINSNYELDVDYVIVQIKRIEVEIAVEKVSYTYNGLDQFPLIEAYFYTLNNEIETLELIPQEIRNVGTYEVSLASPIKDEYFIISNHLMVEIKPFELEVQLETEEGIYNTLSHTPKAYYRRIEDNAIVYVDLMIPNIVDIGKYTLTVNEETVDKNYKILNTQLYYCVYAYIDVDISYFHDPKTGYIYINNILISVPSANFDVDFDQFIKYVSYKIIAEDSTEVEYMEKGKEYEIIFESNNEYVKINTTRLSVVWSLGDE